MPPPALPGVRDAGRSWERGQGPEGTPPPLWFSAVRSRNTDHLLAGLGAANRAPPLPEVQRAGPQPGDERAALFWDGGPFAFAYLQIAVVSQRHAGGAIRRSRCDS